MKNRSLLVLGASTVLLGFAGVVSAVSLQFDFRGSYQGGIDEKRASVIHFADNGNNFGGLLWVAENADGEEGESDKTLTLNGDNYTCAKRIKGFYYNSQRGERLWPMDEETSDSWGTNYDELTTVGGFYTACIPSGYKNQWDECNILIDSNTGCIENETGCNECREMVEKYKDLNLGIYGSVTHTYRGQNLYLVAGTKYTKDFGPWIEMDDEFAPTFVLMNNYYLGLLYDSIAGLGFVGCQVTNSGALEQLIKTNNGEIPSNFVVDTGVGYPVSMFGGFECNPDYLGKATNLLGVIVHGLISWSTDVSQKGIGLLNGNTDDSKMQYFSTDSVSNATLINTTRAKAAAKCGKNWKKRSDSSDKFSNSDIACIDANGSGEPIDADNPKWAGKTLIVKNGSVKVSPLTQNDLDNGKKPYDIFVDGGNLYVNDDVDKEFVFDKTGFPTGIDPGYFSEEIQNNRWCSYSDESGLLHKWGEASYDYTVASKSEERCIPLSYEGTGVTVAKLLRGNFIVGGSIKSLGGDSTFSSKYFVHGKLSSLDNEESLKNTFVWRCKDGVENGGRYCLNDGNSAFQSASLVIIDQNYDSPLFW